MLNLRTIVQWELLLCSLLGNSHLSFLLCSSLSHTLSKAALLFFFVVVVRSLQNSRGRCMSFRVTKTWGQDSVLPLIWWCCNYSLLQNKSPHESVISAEFGRDSLSLLHLESAWLKDWSLESSKAGYLYFSILNIVGWIFLLKGTGICRMFSSILVFYPLDASCTPSLVVKTKNCQILGRGGRQHYPQMKTKVSLACLHLW